MYVHVGVKRRRVPRMLALSMYNCLGYIWPPAESDNKLPYKEEFLERLTEQYGESDSILGWDEQEYGVIYAAIEENDKTHIGVLDCLDKWWFETI